MDQPADTAARIRELIAHHLGVDDDAVTDEAKIADDLGADSLDCVELIMTAEEQFSVEITDDEAETVATVGDAIRLIGDKLGAKAPA